MKKNRVTLFIIGVTFVIAMLFQLITSIPVRDLKAEEGQMRVYTVPSDAVLALKGAWEYFPGASSIEIEPQPSTQYAEIEHLWERNDQGVAYGLATYRLTLSGLLPGKHYGITVQDEASSYALRINDNLILSNGNPSENPNVYVGDVKVQKGVFQSDQNGVAVMVMTIANYDRTIGGFWHPVIIGSLDAIDDYTSRIAAVEVFLFSAMLSLGLFFLLLSSIDSENRALGMSIFSFAVAFRVVATGMHLLHELDTTMSLMTITKLDYLSGYLLLPIVGLLIESFGFIKPIKSIRISMFALIPVVVIFCAFANDVWLERSYVVYEILVLLYMGYGLYAILTGLRHRIEGVQAIGSGVLFLIAGGLLEFFFPNIKYGLYFCSFMFVLLVAVSVMARFATIHSRRESLETEVLTDALTQVGNRTALYKALNRIEDLPGSLVRYVLFIDLNKFKQINDEYGHKAGDAVLVETARRLKRSTRQSDRIYRYGGDEFVIIADLAPDFEIETLMARIRSNFETPFEFEDLALTVNLAIGVERLDGNVTSADDILKKSDMRMYEDKRSKND